MNTDRRKTVWVQKGLSKGRHGWTRKSVGRMRTDLDFRAEVKMLKNNLTSLEFIFHSNCTHVFKPRELTQGEAGEDALCVWIW